MNWKLIFVGGLVFYVVMFVVSFATGPLVHNNILMSTYQATGQFWRPELMSDPPNMAALLPRWVTTGLIGAFVCAGIYGQVRSSFVGTGWQRGAKFGFLLGLVMAVTYFNVSGALNLPDRIWGWWSAEVVLLNVIGGAALGWVADKLAPKAG